MAARIFAFVFLVVILAATRLIPHPPNFSPMLAIALFAGAKAPKRWLAYLAPLLALWISDFALESHYMMIITGLCILLTAGVGALTEKWVGEESAGKKVFGFATAGLLSSVLFFLVTNFFVWQTSGMYPLTQEGLANCFTMALPFFHDQVLSTWVFSGVAFGAWAIAEPRFALAKAR
jgi:hypothetical protein